MTEEKTTKEENKVEAVAEVKAVAPKVDIKTPSSSGASKAGGFVKKEFTKNTRPKNKRHSKRPEKPRSEYDQKIISIRRVTRVVAGGRRFSFSVAMVIGDRKGRVGVGVGKAPDTSLAIEKSVRSAKKNLIKVPLLKGTIPHEQLGKYGGGLVLIKPAAPGTGVLAGGSMRAVLESAGYTDILAKSKGSSNPHNVVKATIEALMKLRDAIAVSSNVYFYEIGGGFGDQEGLGIKNIEKYMRMFGFGEKTDVYPDEILEEKSGVIPNQEWKEENFDGEQWRIGDTYHTAIGQYGFQVTALQLARAVGAIANGGRLYKPTLLLGEGGQSDRASVRKKYYPVVREGMRQAVTDGTAKGLYIPQVKVAAKTGTAQLGTTKTYVNSLVVGFFPYDNPKYAFAVIMEKGKQSNTIGALYIMRQLLEWMAENTPEYLE